MFQWELLCRLSDAELATCDVAEVNLACAEGLPGAEKINHFECIDRLNHYARCVHHYTAQRMLGFYENREDYDNSEPKFRIVCMIKLLQTVYGVRYNPAKKPVEAVFDTEDTFIHGALMGEGGTCASLPVVYAAVGRRLGYPLKLVNCKEHLFVRWDEADGERFNIEVNDLGTNVPPDDHYRQGQYGVSREIEKAYCFLQSMTPRTELANFVGQRGYRWLDRGRYQEAIEAFSYAAALAPLNKGYQNCVRIILNRWQKSWWSSGERKSNIANRIDHRFFA